MAVSAGEIFLGAPEAGGLAGECRGEGIHLDDAATLTYSIQRNRCNSTRARPMATAPEMWILESHDRTVHSSDAGITPSSTGLGKSGP